MKILRSHVVLPTDVDFTMDALYKPEHYPTTEAGAGTICAEPRDDMVTASSYSAGAPVGGHLMVVVEIGRRRSTAGRSVHGQRLPERPDPPDR